MIKTYKLRDLLYIDIYNTEEKSKKIGFIDDIIVDKALGKIQGFSINLSNIFKFRAYVDIEDINKENGKNNLFAYKCEMGENYEYYKKRIYIDKMKNVDGARFKNYLSMKVFDRKNNLIGIVKDIVFDCNFNIMGIVIWENFFHSMKHGKRVIHKNYMEMADNVIYCSEPCGFSCYSLFHDLKGEGIEK